MSSRWARPDELPALQALWTRVFGDGAEVTDSFFRRFPQEQHTRVIEAEGKIAVMANWIPVTLDDQPGAYVYAVATAREYRGRGFARTLMGELEQALSSRGLAFSALCPAERSLYDFYAALGYETAFFCDRFACAPEGEGLALTPLAPAQYRTAREALLPAPGCLWNEAALSYLADTVTRFYGFPGGCAAISVLPDGSLRVPELLCENAAETGPGLCAALGAPRAEVFAPGIMQPRGMLKWFTFGQKIPRAYLGFAFD